eukprot:358784-Chlamydomonas_euryale.AAC.15
MQEEAFCVHSTRRSQRLLLASTSCYNWTLLSAPSAAAGAPELVAGTGPYDAVITVNHSRIQTYADNCHLASTVHVPRQDIMMLVSFQVNLTWHKPGAFWRVLLCIPLTGAVPGTSRFLTGEAPGMSRFLAGAVPGTYHAEVTVAHLHHTVSAYVLVHVLAGKPPEPAPSPYPPPTPQLPNEAGAGFATHLVACELLVFCDRHKGLMLVTDIRA